MILGVVLEVHRAVKTGADDLADVGVAAPPPTPTVNNHITITVKSYCNGIIT